MAVGRKTEEIGESWNGSIPELVTSFRRSKEDVFTQ